MIDLLKALLPIILLFGIACICVWPSLGLKKHRFFRPESGNWSHETGDPIADVRDRAEKAGLDIDIRHPNE